jgi:hypothetical protein
MARGAQHFGSWCCLKKIKARHPVYNNDGEVKGKRGRRHLGFLRGAISLSLKVLFLA